MREKKLRWRRRCHSVSPSLSLSLSLGETEGVREGVREGLREGAARSRTTRTSAQIRSFVWRGSSGCPDAPDGASDALGGPWRRVRRPTARTTRTTGPHTRGHCSIVPPTPWRRHGDIPTGRAPDRLPSARLLGLALLDALRAAAPRAAHRHLRSEDEYIIYIYIICIYINDIYIHIYTYRRLRPHSVV